MSSRKMGMELSFGVGSPAECARAMIGCRLEWKGCAGIVVETEAYEAEGDKACHTHTRPSARRFIEEHEAGTAYVYLNYGVHWLFNLLVKGGGSDGFVLFRALEPVAGHSTMRARRGREGLRELCSGPGKLTQALGIDGDLHGVRIFQAEGFALVKNEREPEPTACRRVGISSARGRKLRFVRRGSPSLSVHPGAE